MLFFPDIDLYWFYFVDGRSFHHHRYWVHIPLFMVLVSVALIVLARRHPVAIAFSAGWALHILLDAPNGQLMWLWPLSDKLYAPIHVPSKGGFWVMSFLTHWSIALELFVWAIAAALFLRRKRTV